MADRINRRDFIRESTVLGAAAAAMGLAGPAEGRPKSPRRIPTIRLGRLRVSRLILGSNPFWGYAHGGDGGAMRKYYTDDRIIATMDEAAGWGISAVATPPSDRWNALWKRYREGGGRLRHWIAQPHGKPDRFLEEIAWCAEGGASAVFIQGLRADDQFSGGGFDTLETWLEQIRRFQLPAGIASHRSDTHPEYQRRGLPVEFFFQCFYRNDRWDPADRDRAVATLARLKAPVVGYKILAAGHIPAKDGFEFAFRHLARKDGVCVGVFPKDDPDQVEEDAAFARRLCGA